MAKTMKRVISLLLAVVLVVGTFAGCGKSDKEETAAITATAVKYSKSGQLPLPQSNTPKAVSIPRR